MIKVIASKEISVVTELFLDVTKTMINNNIYQWDEVYPNAEILMEDINSSQAYGYYVDDDLVGYLVLSENFDKEYEEIDWQFLDEKPLIVHRLAVKSNYQGCGIAKELMAYAESYALENNYSVIRLDAFSKNPNALALYRRLKYTYAGNVMFRKGVFYCFEKRLKK